MAALRQVTSLTPSVDAILLGGDVVMNSVSADEARVDAQWELWRRARKEVELPTVFPCIGNQDIWGWNQKASGCRGDEPLFGKARALQELGLPRSYYATRLRSWRLIVLDSCQRGGSHGFLAELDGAQRDWLAEELDRDQTSPTVVMSHVPIVPGPAEFFASDVVKPDKQGNWALPTHLVHADAHDLTELFRRHSNVRLCLAGHTHIAQRIDYGGVTFVGSPPVCGAWWRGDFLHQPPAFHVIDLRPDGTFAVEEVRLS